MNKTGKIIAIVLGIAALLVVAALVLAKVLITPERVRQTVLPLAEKHLNRTVTLEDVEVSLFSGIELQGLAVGEASGEGTFVATDLVRLRYRLLPLLAMRVVVDEVRLEGPRIRVERRADGTFNFSDLLGAEGKKDEAAAAAPPESKGKSIDLLVSEVAIERGQLQFIDHQVEKGKVHRTTVEDLGLSAKDISLAVAFPVSVEGMVNQAPLGFDGKVDAQQASGSGTLTLSGLDATAFAPYFRDQLPGRLGGLKVDLELEGQGSAAAASARGKLRLSDIDLMLEALPEAPIKGAVAQLDYDVKYDKAGARLELGRNTLRFNDIVAILSGQLGKLDGKPEIAATLEVPDLEVRKALASLPAGLVAAAADLDPAGTVALTANLAGGLDAPLKLLKDGLVKLAGVQVAAGGMRPQLDGQLNLAGDSVQSDNLVVTLGENRANIALKASNLFGKPIVVQSDVTSERFLIDPLLGGAAAPAAASAQKGEAAAPVEIGPFDLPLKAEGSVRVAKGLYRGLEVDDFVMRYRLADNLLHLDEISGQMAGGSFKKTGTVNLAQKGLGYDTRIVLDGIQANPFVQAFLPKFAGVITGALDLTLTARGSGISAEALKRNLSADGDLLLSQGQLGGAGLVAGFADFLKLPELRQINFNDGRGAIHVKDGKVALTSSFEGKDVRLAPKGTIGLDGSLDLSLDARLAPALAQKLDRKGSISRYLSDVEGWSAIPLKVGGSVLAPRFVFDTAAVTGQVKDKARKELEKKLQEKVFDRLLPKGGEGEGEEAKEPAKKLIEETFRGLFGN